MQTGVPADTPQHHAAALERAEVRGKQVLLYTSDGPLAGTFTCSRCGASAMQPDLLDHRVECLYRSSRSQALR